MPPISQKERRAILDIIVDYYKTLEYLATFLEEGARNIYPQLKDNDFIKIEQYVCKIESYIDNITHFLQTDGTTPPPDNVKNELTLCVNDIYNTLEDYLQFCDYIKKQTVSDLP